MAHQSSTNAYGATLRRVLDVRGLTIDQLATECGLKRTTINCQIGTLARPRTAWMIERVLGAPIWTPARHFQELTIATNYVGADFVLTGFHALKKRATAAGVPATRGITNKAALLKAVLAHALSQTPSPSHEKATR